MSALRHVSGSLLFTAFAMIACAPETADSPVGVDFRMSGITRDQVGQVQVSIVSDAKTIQGNPQLGFACIKDIVTDRSRFVLMDDGKKSFRFNASESRPQKITGISVGRNYMFVGEATAKDTSQLIGQATFVVPELNAGDEVTVPLNMVGRDGGGILADCDPLF